MTINLKTYRKFEKVAGMKFVAIYHKGSWGHWAMCALEDGTVWAVNKNTGEKYCKSDEKYINGKFVIIFSSDLVEIND